MFKIEKSGTNQLNIEMNGKLNAEGMKVALGDLVSKSEGIENGALLYDIIDFRIPSLHAIAVEFSRLPSMFQLLRQFKRAAVLTDKIWLKKASEIEGKLIPGITIKAFDRSQKEKANAWLSEK